MCRTTPFSRPWSSLRIWRYSEQRELHLEPFYSIREIQEGSKHFIYFSNANPHTLLACSFSFDRRQIKTQSAFGFANLRIADARCCSNAEYPMRFSDVAETELNLGRMCARRRWTSEWSVRADSDWGRTRAGTRSWKLARYRVKPHRGLHICTCVMQFTSPIKFQDKQI